MAKTLPPELAAFLTWLDVQPICEASRASDIVAARVMDRMLAGIPALDDPAFDLAELPPLDLAMPDLAGELNKLPPLDFRDD